MEKFLSFCFLTFSSLFIMADEYLYPIANLDDETVLMMHQKSLDDLELLSLNIKNNNTQKLLSSLYLPAHVTIIPGGKKYSFIDRGRIYIKDFSKRTPRGLDIYQPISDIQSLQWISNQEFIFSAKYKNHYKLFMYNIKNDGGTLYRLCRLDDDINYIFPSVINKDIICLMQKGFDELYSIVKVFLNPVPFEIPYSEDIKESLFEEISTEHKNPLCFLSMKDQNCGYVLEIIEHNKENGLFVFGCLKVDLEKGSLSKLFEFQIPEHFIIGMDNTRFFESLYPLLPLYTDNQIYFTSYNNDLEKLDLYIYDQGLQVVSKYLTDTRNIETRHSFAPLIVKGSIYLGHNIKE